MKILLGVSSSVAAIYTHKLVDELELVGHTVSVLVTDKSKMFLDKDFIYDRFILSDRSETWQRKGDPISHIELRKNHDMMVIAPASANTIAKLANGICDNLLTEVCRAWDFGKPIVLCPAMNTHMWENPPTSQQLEMLKGYGYDVIEPVAKTLACGDVGIGAMCDHTTIINYIDTSVWSKPLKTIRCIPTDTPGSFGFRRKYDVHTGVDLYCEDGDLVYAMEDGVIVNTEQFTGAALGFPFWEDTDCLMIEGKSGVINYGEVFWYYNSGSVKKGDLIAHVKRVLKPGKERADIPHHSLSMLHIELYRRGTRKPTLWHLDEAKPSCLLDPTTRLKGMFEC